MPWQLPLAASLFIGLFAGLSVKNNCRSSKAVDTSKSECPLGRWAELRHSISHESMVCGGGYKPAPII
jgi:hypothetical protein